MNIWENFRFRRLGNLTLFATITLLVLPSLLAAPQSGRVTVAVGQVTFIENEGAEAVTVAPGDQVAVGGTIKTGADSRAVIVITPRSAIRVSENSEVFIEEVDESATPQRVMLDLKSGSMGALLKPNAAGEMDFKIRTPTGVAAARGTYFAVVVENGKGFAQVKEGRVEIIPNAEQEDDADADADANDPN